MLQCETITPDRLTHQDRAAWIALAQATGLASPLLHPDFALAVARVRDDVRIALYRDDAGLAGVFAHHRRPGGYARPVGAAFSDLHAILTRPDLGAAPAELLRMAGISRARFFAAFACAAPAADAMAPAGQSHAAVLRTTAQALVEELRADHPKRFKDLRRRMRRLEDDHGAVRLEASQDIADLKRLMAWKSQQYHSTGKHDVLAPKWAAHLMRVLFEGQGGEVTGRLLTFKAGDRVIAAEFGPQWGGTFHPWLAAYDSDMASHSPGHLLVCKLIETMPELGLTRYEMGAGHEDYKKYFTNHLTALHAGMVRGPGMASAARDGALATLNAMTALGGAQARALAARLHRRIDQIAAVEISMQGRLAGMTRAATGLLASSGR